eukprot:524930_1
MGTCASCSPSPEVHITKGQKCVAFDYTKCDAMARLISSSKHYSILTTAKNTDFDETLIRFMNDTYNGTDHGLIDDYIHFKEHHEDELERIHDDLIRSNALSDCSCSILQCAFTARHMQGQSTCTSNSKLAFYVEIFDALHFHLLHCFEAGLRMRRSDDNDEIEEEEKALALFDEQSTKDEYFDVQFARMNRRILARHGNTASFDRFLPKNTKFNILNEEKHDTPQS